MIKFYKNKNIKLKTKIGLTISVIAFFIAIANIFFNNEIVRAMIWVMCVCVFALSIISDFEEIIRLQKENILKAYEIDCLRWSYRSMGNILNIRIFLSLTILISESVMSLMTLKSKKKIMLSV